MGTQFLNVEIGDGIAVVTLDRPPVNALNNDFMSEIEETFRGFEDSREVRVAVLRSAVDRAFSAGADLKGGRRAAPPEDATSSPSGAPASPERSAVAEMFWSVYDCAVPVVASVDGPVLGAGLSLVACCDIVVASERATFGLPELNVGLLGGGAQLLRLVGPQAMRLAYFTATPLSAEDMLRLGAVARVTSREDLLPETMAIARSIAEKSPIAVRLAKRALNEGEHLPLKEAYALERKYSSQLAGYEDSRESVRAFLEKRAPVFQWR